MNRTQKQGDNCIDASMRATLSFNHQNYYSNSPHDLRRYAHESYYIYYLKT